MTLPIRRILVLGGYGSFGARLVELLSSDAELEILVAGRSLAKAEQFCGALDAEASLLPVMVDRDGDIRASLAKLQPDLVVDASGPFQAYGKDPYRVVVAAITLGIHYADLADGAEFVRGIGQFNGAARRAYVFAISGLSTCPALTTAAVRHLSRDLSQVETIEAGIAPSPAAETGVSAVRAVAGYAGEPVTVVDNDCSRNGIAFDEHRAFTIAPPGRLPLFRRRFSLVEVPDLTLLGDAFPDVKSVWVGAAIAPPVLHRALALLARLRRWRALPSLLPLTRALHWIACRCSWGEHRGGMYVKVAGRRGVTHDIERTWHLTADGARGPYIPAIAAAAIVDRCNSGRPPPVGARPATGELEMSDFQYYFDNLGINQDVRYEAADSHSSLYRRVIGRAWLALPPSVRQLHGSTETRQWRGRAKVSRGTNVLARTIGAIFRFPKASDDVEVTVEFRRENGRETWIRNFAGRRFSSVQYQGVGAWDGLLCERFGPFTFGLATVVESGKLLVPIRRWSFLGLRLPLWLAPQSSTYECDDNGRFRFHVDIGLPLIGHVVRYEGYFDEEFGTGAGSLHSYKFDRIVRACSATSGYIQEVTDTNKNDLLNR